MYSFVIVVSTTALVNDIGYTFIGISYRSSSLLVQLLTTLLLFPFHNLRLLSISPVMYPKLKFSLPDRSIIPQAATPTTSDKDPASKKFFATEELVLLMLIFLPTTSLITSMRVNKKFNRIIRDEEALKQTLFLQPAPPVAYYDFEGRCHARDSRAIHGLELTERPVIFKHVADLEEEFSIGTVNPLFDCEDHSGNSAYDTCIGFSMSLKKLLDHHDRMEATRQGKIWNQMFTCQPPAVRAILNFNCAVREPDEEVKLLDTGCVSCKSYFELRNDDGIRVVDVARKIRAEIERFEAANGGAKSYVLSDRLIILCQAVVDELCSWIQEAVMNGFMSGLEPGDPLVPVQSGEVHVARDLRYKRPAC